MMPLNNEDVVLISGLDNTEAFKLPETQSIPPSSLDPLSSDNQKIFCDRMNGLEPGTLYFHDLLKHTNGTYTHKKALLESLSFIDLALEEALRPDVISEEVKNYFVSIGRRLSDGIEECTAGFHDRVNSVVNALRYKEVSLTEYIYQYRVALVEKAFNKSSTDVHAYNSFFRVANALGFGVLPVSENDIYTGNVSDTKIQDTLFQTFKKDYTPTAILLSVIESIKASLSKKYAYLGCQKEGYPNSQYQGFLCFIQSMLKEQESDNRLLRMDEVSDAVVDIDFGYLTHKVASFLLNESVFNEPALSLFFPASEGHKEIALALIEAGIKVDEKDSDGNTPIIYAARKGHTEIAITLIEAGAKLDEKNKKTNTALILAAFNGHKEIALALIDAGAQLDEKNDFGSTALILAASNGHKEIALALIKAGAKLDEINIDGRAALILAVWYGHKEIGLALIDAGANVDEKDNYANTPLIYAARKGRTEIALTLIEAGAKLDEKNERDETALSFAVGFWDNVIADAIRKKMAENASSLNQSYPYRFFSSASRRDLDFNPEDSLRCILQ
jgi:ankyrin repeat protein